MLHCKEIPGDVCSLQPKDSGLDCSQPLSNRRKTPMLNPGKTPEIGPKEGNQAQLWSYKLFLWTYADFDDFWWFLMVGLAILGCCKHGPNSLHQSEGVQAYCFHVSRFLCAALVDLSPGWTEKRRLCWPLEVGTTSFVKSPFRYLLDEVVSKMEQNSLSSLWNLTKTLCNGKLCWLSDRFDFAIADSFLHLHVPGSITAWGVARASVFSNHLATKQLKRKRQCWGLVKLEMRMVWLGANSPSVFISRTNRSEDWISDCLIL